MEFVLRTDALSKSYSGTKVVDGVSVTVKPGDIYGFVGKNGAGKTTFIRMILGLTPVTEGSFEFFDGEDIRTARMRTGSLVEGPALYKNMSARHNLELYCTMLGADISCVDDILKTVGLSDTGKKKAKDFSLGMKQRLAIGMALVGDPEFLVLDEPINGLDPTGIVEIRELLLKLKDEGKTIFISSHILGELEKIATRYGIISKGRLVEEITQDELKTLCVPKTIVKTSDPEKALAIAKKVLDTNDIIIKDDALVIGKTIDNIGMLTNEMFVSGIVVSGINTDDDSAEEYFIKKMEEG